MTLGGETFEGSAIGVACARKNSWNSRLTNWDDQLTTLDFTSFHTHVR